jgi:hypothetical protein
MEKFAEALPYFRRAAELEPDNTTFLTNLGAALAFEEMDASNAVARENLARARRSFEGKKS